MTAPILDPGVSGELGRVVDAIVDLVQPIEVILFGSQARQDATNDSDFDLLVVMPDGTHRRETAKAIYRALLRVHGRTRAVDIVVMTPGEVDRGRNDIGTIARAVHLDGRPLYRQHPPLSA